MKFFTGLHQPSDAKHFTSSKYGVCISVKRLYKRKTFIAGNWMMDSGAFSELNLHGRYRHSVKRYAKEIKRWKHTGNLLAAVSQDYMCEAFMLKKTGLTIKQHQRRTIKRYDKLLQCNTGCYTLPVIQGYKPKAYVKHLRMYGNRLAKGAWVGVGSVCKRNANVSSILAVLKAIKDVRPDLRIHGFGLKKTALNSPEVRALLYSSDSMAWSYAARSYGKQNDWREAKRYTKQIHRMIK